MRDFIHLSPDLRVSWVRSDIFNGCFGFKTGKVITLHMRGNFNIFSGTYIIGNPFHAIIENGYIIQVIEDFRTGINTFRGGYNNSVTTSYLPSISAPVLPSPYLSSSPQRGNSRRNNTYNEPRPNCIRRVMDAVTGETRACRNVARAGHNTCHVHRFRD